MTVNLPDFSVLLFSFSSGEINNRTFIFLPYQRVCNQNDTPNHTKGHINSNVMVHLRLADVGEVFHNVLFWLISLFALPGNYYYVFLFLFINMMLCSWLF